MKEARIYLVWDQCGYTFKKGIQLLGFRWNKGIFISKHIDNPRKPAIVQFILCLLKIQDNSVLKRLKLYWSISSEIRKFYSRLFSC